MIDFSRVANFDSQPYNKEHFPFVSGEQQIFGAING